MESIEAALKHRANDSFIGENDCITVGQVRELIHELKQQSFAAELFKTANAGLGARLLAGRKDKLVHVPGKRPATSAPALVFFPMGSLGEEVAA